MATAKKTTYVRNNVPLSRFGVLVAQLESLVASSSHKPLDPLICFDLLSDVISAIDDEPRDSMMLSQRKCEDVLHSLLILGVRRPVRHLASVAITRIISKGDTISIYSRASSLQGFLSDGKRSEPQRVAGAAQCLGELYRLFGRKITTGLLETVGIATKLMKSHEEYVRKEALYMLRNAVEGCGGGGSTAAYTEAFRLVMRLGVTDKSSIVRIAAARCLKAFADIGGPGLGVVELDNSASICVKAFYDSSSSVRDAFAEALGALLALGMNHEAQVQPRGKGEFSSEKKLKGSLERHLMSTFVKASGMHSREVRVCLALAWVSFLQAILLKYQYPDSELHEFALQVLEMLRGDTSGDAQALACVVYILRVGVVDEMTEPTQRSFLVVVGKQLKSSGVSPPMKVAVLRTLSYILKTLGEVPVEFREVLDDTVIGALSHPVHLVRVEAALTLRALAEVDPTCVGGLVSFGVTTLTALRESVSFEKGNSSQVDLDSLHGQATLLAALVFISPKLPLGYPARLPHSVLEVSKKMLTEPSRNLGAANVMKEAGWLLLASLVAAIPKEELEDQVFDILALWAPIFSGNPELKIGQSGDLTSKIRVWSAAVDALAAFIRHFVSPQAVNYGILIQPVLVYLSSALSHISIISAKDPPDTKLAMNEFIIRTLIAFQSLSDPMSYKTDHPKLLQLCTAPFRNPSHYEESTCLRMLLDKRDAWLGPWIPGRDWFEDELRSFEGGKDGLMPCIWDPELPSFPQPQTVSKMLVNQKLLCFGTLFAFQDIGGMQSLLGMIEQCLKTGKKQAWHTSSVSNICSGLLAGLKAVLSFRPQFLGSEILSSLQSIFQSILAEGDISASQRRASSEILGLLTRLGNDVFTARMTRTLLGDLASATDASYAGSVSVALGCIHRSAGGMALSSLVPATVSSISSLAKSSVAGLQIWSLHGLLLTIEAAGLSYISHVQATLNLGLEILLSEENGWVDLQQGVGRLINAIVAVLGPELAPGSIFFSRCKSVIAEISSYQETTTLLENIRFTQQLVLFAPQALSVHSHVQTLIPTLSSRQPILRHLAISTLRHLIEKDPVSVIHEQIEENLFHMLDEETDAEIGNLVRSTIIRLLYASCPTGPSHWISICRKVVLAISSRNSVINGSTEQDPRETSEGDSRLGLGEDDENMVSSSKAPPKQGYSFDTSGVNAKRDKHLRYRTRLFAAECLSHLPTAVGENPAHFDLSLARKQKKELIGGDWLVLQLPELISVAFQISTIQFENMRPIGVGLLSTMMNKYEEAPDPELPGHLLLEQYQAQLVSALRSALDLSSVPMLLEAGLHLATKILISGIIRGDEAAIKRIFLLISRPLNDFEDLYYPSFAEWVCCKIKVRLLAAHASLKCYTYTFLRRGNKKVPDEYLALLPLFSKSSSELGKRWIGVLKDHCYLCFNPQFKNNWKPLLEGIKSPSVSSKLKSCLEEAWPVILQAVALDAAPVGADINTSSDQIEEKVEKNFMSGYKMVELEVEDFHFLWGLALLILFQGQNATDNKLIVPLAPTKTKCVGDSLFEETKPSQKLYEIVVPIFFSLCAKTFFSMRFLTVDICSELLQVFTYVGADEYSWNSLAATVLAQIVHGCPDDFLNINKFADLLIELCLTYLYKNFSGNNTLQHDETSSLGLTSQLLATAKMLLSRLGKEKQLKLILAFMLVGYKSARVASTEETFSKINEFILHTSAVLKKFVEAGKSVNELDTQQYIQSTIGACQSYINDFSKDCIEVIPLLENRRTSSRRLVYSKLAFCLEQFLSFADMVYKLELNQEDKSSMNVAIFIGCTGSIRRVLTDTSTHVQAIGLQVLKNIIQKSGHSKANPLLLILTGELVRDILMIIQKIITNSVTKESAAVVGECLKTLVLMQTLPEDSKCQKGLMNLLLEAVVMILSGTEETLSQETTELRSIAIRLVSNLVQVPSAAGHLKEVLLEMPGTHRQQIQSIFLASVTQDHHTTVTSSVPAFEIKLPHQPEGFKEENNLASPSHQTAEDFDDDDDDDWDAFQSFPTTNETVVDSRSAFESSSLSRKNSDENFQAFSTSPLLNEPIKETCGDHQNDEKEGAALESPRKSGCDDQVPEAEKSHDCGSVSADVPIQDDFLASLDFLQLGSDMKESAETNFLMGNSMNEENQSGLLLDSSKVGHISNPVDVQAPPNSEELGELTLEAGNQVEEDKSLKSAETENIELLETSQLSSSLDRQVEIEQETNTNENFGVRSSLENQDIGLDQGASCSSELLENQDTAMEPDTPEVTEEFREVTSTVCDSISGKSQGACHSPGLPTDQDKVETTEAAS